MNQVVVYSIILGGGSGTRLKGKIPKQFINLGEKTILEYTIDKFNENENINYIILVVNPKYRDKELEQQIFDKYKKVIKIVDGGKTRRESTYNALKVINGETNCKVLIHDGVRPFVSNQTINRIINELEFHRAVYPAVSTVDTIIKVDDNNYVDNIPIRKYMMRGQTPQGFSYNIILRAHELAKNDKNVDEEVTNDCGLVKRYNLCKIKVVEGNRENIKITYPEDLLLIKKLYGE